MLDTRFQQCLQAIKDSDLKEIERLIESGFDPNTLFDENGLSLIHLAAFCNMPLILKLLIEHKARVDQEELRTQKTALHIAAFYGHLDCCKILITGNSSKNARDIASFTPLHYAALKGHLKVVELLFDSAEVLWTSSPCGTPIDVAIKHENIDVIGLFLTKLKEYTSEIYNKSNNNSIFHFLKKHTLPSFPANPFYFATLIGSEYLIRGLLQEQLLLEVDMIGLREDGSGMTPLHLAAEKGNSGIVRLLLQEKEYSSKEDMYCSSPLELAIQNGHQSTIDAFIEIGAKPWLIDKKQLFGYRPKSVLSAAVWDGNYLQLKEILEHEGPSILFEPNEEDGDPPLQIAILCRQTEIAKLFVEYGGKELVAQNLGDEMTALHRAAFHGVLDLYQLFFHIGGSGLLKQKCEPFGTPLDCALWSNHIEIVEWTLSQPHLDLTYDELFYNLRENWALMDINPSIGGYFREIEKSFP